MLYMSQRLCDVACHSHTTVRLKYRLLVCCCGVHLLDDGKEGLDLKDRVFKDTNLAPLCSSSWPRGGLVDLATPNKALPNWNMERYKSMGLSSNFQYQIPLHKHKAAYWRLSGVGSSVLICSELYFSIALAGVLPRSEKGFSLNSLRWSCPIRLMVAVTGFW